MVGQSRGEGGKFVPKADEPREVRSIRLTNTTWEKLGAAAELKGMTRADLIEQLVEDGLLDQQSSSKHISLQRMEEAITQILDDQVVTRKGKDRGSVKRALQALMERLS